MRHTVQHLLCKGMFIGLCLGIMASIFLGDLWIKNQIERKGVEGVTSPILGGRLIIGKHHNKGAVLNLFQRRRPVVAALSVGMTVVALLVFLLSLGQHGNRLLCVGLSFVLGGAFSNTYDRLHRKYVVDYVSFGVPWKRFRNILFNISDFCIIIGALLTAMGAAQ